jgi:biotin carboxyl carrier protein
MTEKKISPAPGEKPELKKLDILGDVYYTTFNKKYENRQKWSKPNEKEVISIIPGTIRQVLVRKGDRVKTADKMLVLEAMKMMNSIYSPIEGKIRSVRVKEGDSIPKGTLMIEFE